MSQSNVIAGFLTLAFIVFITMRGELPVYMGFLLSDPKQAPGTGGGISGATVNAGSASGPFQFSGNATTNANVNKTIDAGVKLFGMI